MAIEIPVLLCLPLDKLLNSKWWGLRPWLLGSERERAAKLNINLYFHNKYGVIMSEKEKGQLHC